jgi:putative pyruvate formate lyase activating enzyme
MIQGESCLRPSYLKLFESEELDKRIDMLFKVLESCELCPRKCMVNRLGGEIGVCNSGKELAVSSYAPHYGEERPLVGVGGSGTIFLTHCNLLCVYCQNYDISHQGYGREITSGRAAGMMLDLQGMGCHNINFVSPTHFAPQLIKATKLVIEKGLRLPIVWNCSGYENVEIIKLLDGIVDIYMPDIKYSQGEPAQKYSKAPDYFTRCKEAVSEMHRQVGDLRLDDSGIAFRGLLIRHLVLPNNLAGSEEVLEFIAELSVDSYVNIMSQYRPQGEAYRYKELNRRPTTEEFNKSIDIARRLGLTRGFQRKHLERFRNLFF